MLGLVVLVFFAAFGLHALLVREKSEKKGGEDEE